MCDTKFPPFFYLVTSTQTSLARLPSSSLGRLKPVKFQPLFEFISNLFVDDFTTTFFAILMRYAYLFELNKHLLLPFLMPQDQTASNKIKWIW